MHKQLHRSTECTVYIQYSLACLVWVCVGLYIGIEFWQTSAQLVRVITGWSGILALHFLRKWMEVEWAWLWA